MSGTYDDIINLPHHVSASRPQMSGIDRAAQFAPFAALTGFGAAITETGRLTEEKVELDEYEKEALNERLNLIGERISKHPAVSVTYFKPDERKAGGAYVSVTGAAKKLDDYELVLVMADGTKIPFDDIIDIEVH